MNKATRGDGLRLVPSQRTERIQATDPPKIAWPEKPGVNLTTLGVIACSCFIVGYCLVSVGIAAWEFFK